jgi:hypothetical protein
MFIVRRFEYVVFSPNRRTTDQPPAFRKSANEEINSGSHITSSIAGSSILRKHSFPERAALMGESLVEFLKWKDVNLKAQGVTITTYKDKNMKQWEISVSTRLKAELMKLKLQRKSDDADERLFASASVNLRKVWEAARKEASITSMRFHDLRHTFATRVANAGMEMQELAKILGHTDISMTYRY